MLIRLDRQQAPCLLIFEDLDSLVNSENRSVFLNQLDGISGSKGVAVLATTNHCTRTFLRIQSISNKNAILYS